MTSDHQFQKRSVSLHGHKTSVSLERAFWNVLEQAAKDQNMSLSQLIREIDEKRQGALASALRLYALRYPTPPKILLEKNKNLN